MATTKKDPAAVALGRKGGKARLEKLTDQQRKEIATAAATARWAKAEKPAKKATKQAAKKAAKKTAAKPARKQKG